MIKQETVTFSKRELIHTYSDDGVYIRQNETGVLYDEAYDVPGNYTYTETDIPIIANPDEEITDSEALNILLGGEANSETDRSDTP